MQSPDRTAAAEEKVAALRAEFTEWLIDELEEGGYRAKRHHHERDRSHLGIVQSMISGSLTMLEWRLEQQRAMRIDAGLQP